MQRDLTQYSLQLRPIAPTADSAQAFSALEVVAQPSGSGNILTGRFQQWEPIFERICAFVSTSPFHRKVMHRTLTAGLPTHVIDRATGSMQMFSHAQIAELRLDEEMEPAA